MRETSRSKLITVLALSIAFVVMIAALAYNPAKSGMIDFQVYGKVTDENGTPLSNATVIFQNAGQSIMRTMAGEQPQYVTTDSNGRFSAELSSERFHIPGTVICVAFTSQNSRWIQGRNVTVTGDGSTELDFVLVNNTRFFLPVGPIVLANTSNHTQVEISTHLEGVNEYSFMYQPNCGSGFSPRETTVNTTSDSGSLVLNGVYGYITGAYYNISDGRYEVEWCTLSIDSDSTGLLTNKTLDADYIDPSSVAEQSTFCALSLGQNITISASLDRNLTLPEVLSPEADTPVLEPKGVTCMYSDWYHDEYGGGYVRDNHTSVSVTITPLTPGTHEYQVYIEYGCIVHVWELSPQQG